MHLDGCALPGGFKSIICCGAILCPVPVAVGSVRAAGKWLRSSAMARKKTCLRGRMLMDFLTCYVSLHIFRGRSRLQQQ